MLRKFNTFYLFFLFFFAEYFYPVSFLFFNNIRIKNFVFCYAQEKLIRSTKKNIIKFLEIYHFTKKKNIKFHFTEWFEQSEALNRVLQTLAIIYLLSIQNFHFDSGVAPKRISGWSGVDAFTICHTEELIHIILMKSSLRYSKIKVRPSVALSQGVSV